MSPKRQIAPDIKERIMKIKEYDFLITTLSRTIILILYLALLTMLAGCAIKTPKPLAPAAKLFLDEEHDTVILARALWQDSGVIVEKGSYYDIRAEGRWSMGPICGWTDASGVGVSPLCAGGSVLIGKIGKEDESFTVGKHLILKSEKEGILYLRAADLDAMVWVNSGSMRVCIKQEKLAPIKPEIPPIAEKRPQQAAIVPFPRRDYVSKSWAVIIGISKYKHSGQNDLKNLIFADDDAKAFARVLSNLGWSNSHIKLLVNEQATQRNIMIALESWLTKAGPNDQIVLFWAGHGFPDPEDPEKVYFACYDTDISIPATGYRMDRVRTALEERRSKNVILLADTCHAGKLITRGDRGLSIIPKIDKMRRDKKIPKGWIFMVGADTDRQAIEHTSWSNGAFTHCLIQALTGDADGYESVGPKDGIVTMGELRAYLNSAMPDETQRVLGVAKRPVITTSTGDPDIWNLTLQAK